MEDREKLIAGIVVSIVLVLIGFFVIRGLWPKKQEVVKQLPPVGTNQQVYPTTTPTPTSVQTTNTGGYYYYQSQGSNNSQSQGSQSQSQSGSGQSQSQTLPNGMTQTQNQ